MRCRHQISTLTAQRTPQTRRPEVWEGLRGQRGIRRVKHSKLRKAYLNSETEATITEHTWSVPCPLCKYNNFYFSTSVELLMYKEVYLYTFGCSLEARLFFCWLVLSNFDKIDFWLSLIIFYFAVFCSCLLEYFSYLMRDRKVWV